MKTATKEELWSILNRQVSTEEAFKILFIITEPQQYKHSAESLDFTATYEAYRRLVNMGEIDGDNVWTGQKENRLNDIGFKYYSLYRWDGDKWVDL